MAPCICHPRKIMKLSVCGGGVSILGKGYSILHTILPNWKILTCCPLAAHMTSQRPCCHSRMPAVQKIMKQNKCVGKLIHKSSLGISVPGKIQEEPVSGFRSHIRADAPSERRCTCGQRPSLVPVVKLGSAVYFQGSQTYLYIWRLCLSRILGLQRKTLRAASLSCSVPQCAMQCASVQCANLTEGRAYHSRIATPAMPIHSQLYICQV